MRTQLPIRIVALCTTAFLLCACTTAPTTSTPPTAGTPAPISSATPAPTRSQSQREPSPTTDAPAPPAFAQLVAMDLGRMGGLRVALRSNESIRTESGARIQTDLLRHALERELIARGYKVLRQQPSGTGRYSPSNVERSAHILVELDASADFVNTTGRFAKYRASADARVTRTPDSENLGAVREEQIGERKQISDAAGRAALKALAPRLVAGVLDLIAERAGDLTWSVFAVRGVDSMNGATRLLAIIGKHPAVTNAALLDWDAAEQVAIYEILSAERHAPKLEQVIDDAPDVRVERATAVPNRFPAMRRLMAAYL